MAMLPGTPNFPAPVGGLSWATLLSLLKRAAEAIEAAHQDSEGSLLNDAVACPVCDGAIPTEHSLLCDIKNAVRKAERAS